MKFASIYKQKIMLACKAPPSGESFNGSKPKNHMRYQK